MFANPPGIEDVFPDRAGAWGLVDSAARRVFRVNNYREIIIPVLEYTEVFSRGLGSDTDIVSKEMFTLEDRGGRNLALRPEGTASVVRAYVANGEYNRRSVAKFFYFGPMFRAERPQKGRLRQFNQFGAELFGSADPYFDCESIAMMDSITKDVGIGDYALLLNSIGCRQCRPAFMAELRAYYGRHVEELCEDCRRRLERNALRLLDCKQENCSALKKGAPRITDFLCGDCEAHHGSVKEYLRAHSIAYEDEPHLVRGLDYYTRTTFEFVASRLGGQNAFAGGGRYDGLVESFGGRPTPAVGFAAGIERMVLLLGDSARPAPLDVYMVHSGGEALAKVVRFAAVLRARGVSVDLDPQAKGFGSQFKKADREKARYAMIVGQEETAAGGCTVRNMLTGEQERVPDEKCVELLLARLVVL